MPKPLLACDLLFRAVVLLILASVSASQQATEVLTDKDDRITLAMGSCFKNYLYKDRYDIFDAILTTSPDVFLWTGDAIYASYPWLLDLPRRFPTEKVETFFRELKEHPSNET